MRKKTPTRASRNTPLFPRRKKERRKVNLLGAAAATLFAVLIVAAFFATSLIQPALRSSNTAAVVSAVLVDLANQDRAENSLGDLTVNPLLVEAAQAKANDMATKGYFAHTSPQGLDPWYWFEQVGYKFQYAGENLAVNFSDSGDVNTAWMNSPEHRANILDVHYTEIGIATAQGMYQGQLVTFVVQEFGTPATAAAPQQPVVTESVPTVPTQTAVASTNNQPSEVLGTAAQPEPQKPKAARTKPLALAPTTSAVASVNSAVATTDPVLAASLSKDVGGQIPPWGYVIAFPRDALRDTYLVFGFFILAALVYETGLEVHEKHKRKALVAGGLLIAMCALFVLANYFFFAQPVLALTAASL